MLQMTPPTKTYFIVIKNIAIYLWQFIAFVSVFLQLAMKHQKEMEQLEKNQREQLEKLEKFNEQVHRRKLPFTATTV